MILCDIGNSNIDFYHDGKLWTLNKQEFEEYVPSETVYYINVNPKMIQKLKERKDFINIEEYFMFDTIYQGMGIDRIASCYTVKDGIVIDIGSAITVDIMFNFMHLGGYILPGLNAYSETYKSISTSLDKRLNPNVILDALPQKTEDAVSYGIIKSIIMMIKDTAKEKNIIFTGGDGKFFSKFFKNSIYDRTLIFRGMIKVIEEKR